MLSEKSQQPGLMLGETKVIVFFDPMLHLAPLGTKLAIRPAFLVSQELFLSNTVIAFLLVLVDLPLIEKALQHSLDTAFVKRISRGRPAVITDFQFVPKLSEL